MGMTLRPDRFMRLRLGEWRSAWCASRVLLVWLTLAPSSYVGLLGDASYFIWDSIVSILVSIRISQKWQTRTVVPRCLVHG